MAGIVSGMITKVETVKDIIDRMVAEAEPVLKGIEDNLRA